MGSRFTNKLFSISDKFFGVGVTFIVIFIAVVTILTLGILIGTEKENLDLVHTFSKDAHEEVHKIYETTLLFGLIVTVLLCWTLYVLQKSRENSKIIKQISETLGSEISKRQQTQNMLDKINLELGKSSSKLNAIIECSSDMISAIDKDYRVISFNKSYKEKLKEIFGVEIETGVNLLNATAVHPKLQEQLKQLWDKALSGEQFIAHKQFVDRSKKVNYIEVTYNPIRNSSGEIIGASHIGRDITERKSIEDSLKRERDFISTVVEASNLLVMVTDSDGRITKFNRACEEASGYEFEELKDKVFWDVLIPPEKVEAAKLVHHELKSTSLPKDYTNQWIAKGDKVCLISWRVSLIKDEKGVEYVVLTGIDVTEESEVKEIQKRILDILETSSDFIFISDITGKITYLNSAGRKILSLKDLNGLSEIKIDSYYPKWANELIQSEGIPTALKDGLWVGETALISGSRELPISHLILAHKDEEKGEVKYLSTVARDISRQKRLEGELLSTRDKALEIAKTKSAFLANMSHEIRTSLNGIIGLSEILSNTELTKEQRKYAEAIQSSSDILLTIVNDILDFSKIEAGKFHLEKIVFDLREMAESVLELFAEPVCRKGIEMALFIDHEVPQTLKGDPRRLRQVLTNLVSNAIKFTEKGEIIINVKLDKVKREKTSLYFSVKDTGIGISENAQKYLFEEFTQADASITRHYGGTGLGLTISKQLVELMSGEIGVKSEKGKGAEFWFTLKFESNQSNQNNYSLSFYENLKGLRILIVDDNDKIRKKQSHQLESLGMYVESAASGEEGIEILRTAEKNKAPFQTAIIDLDMPQMNGFEFSKVIKKDSSLRKISILLMLSINDHETLKKLNASDIDAYIFKPLRQTELCKTLSTLLDKKEEKTVDKNTLHSRKLMNEKNKVEESLTKTKIPQKEQKGKILVAEDNRVNQNILLRQLESLGYEADVRNNGEEVLKAIKENAYSLILMDCQMPIMDGFQTAAKVRETEVGSGLRLPIVAITANAMKEDQEKCLLFGMDDYIVKPIKRSELAQVLEKWISPPAGLSKDTENMNYSKSEELSDEAHQIDLRLQDLAESCGDEVALECLEIFTEDFDAAVDRLCEAIETGEMENIDREAHKLKGSVANMGAVKLPSICGNLMEASRSGKVEGGKSKIKDILNERKKLTGIYQKQLQKFKKIVEDLRSSD